MIDFLKDDTLYLVCRTLRFINLNGGGGGGGGMLETFHMNCTK